MSEESVSSAQRQLQIERLARMLAEVIDAYRPPEAAKARPNWPLRAFQALTKNWVVFLFSLSVAGAFVGWLVYDISLLHALEEISQKQKTYHRTEKQIEYRHRLVQRHIDLGNSFLSDAQLEAAKDEFEYALKLDPNNVDAHIGKLKAEIFLPIASKEYVPGIAKRKLDLVLKELPDDAHILSYLGDIHRYISRTQSLKYYEQAIARDPTVAHAYAGMAVIYEMDSKTRDRAVKLYEKALSLSNWNQTYLNNLGYQYLLRNDYGNAIERYELLLNLDDRYLLTYYTLSNALRLTGNLPRAALIQQVLIEQLENDKTTEMRRNAGEWFFHTATRTIHFLDYPMKKCYAQYNAALTAYLSGNVGKAESHVAAARRLKSPNEQLVRELIRHDISNLKQAQKNFSQSLDAFAQRYL